MVERAGDEEPVASWHLARRRRVLGDGEAD